MKDKKLTDKEIIKALEYRLKVNNGTRIDKEVLDLINRLQAENERLKEVNEKLLIDFNGLSGVIHRAKAEAYKECIEQLNAEIESSDKYIREYDDSESQRAYNKGLQDALKALKEMVGE